MQQVQGEDADSATDGKEQEEPQGGAGLRRHTCTACLNSHFNLVGIPTGTLSISLSPSLEGCEPAREPQSLLLQVGRGWREDSRKLDHDVVFRLRDP
jgi:hypothetical protein